MADPIDKAIDQNLIDTFRPLPDRMMHGKAYRNVPFEMWQNGGIAPYDPKQPTAPNSDFLSTDEEGRMLLWQLRQFLGS